MDDSRLQKREIIHKYRSIKTILDIGIMKTGTNLSIYYLLGDIRMVGFIVSKQYQKAVQRNKQKRLLRELYRRNKNIFPVGKVLFYTKYCLHIPTYREYYEDVLGILNKNTSYD